MQRRRLLAVLLALQCAQLSIACSEHNQPSDPDIVEADIDALPRWGQLHHHRRLRQSSSGAAVPEVTVKHLKRRQCGSQQPSNTTQASVQRRLAPHVAQIESLGATQRLAAAPITIDVHMHAIRAVAGDPNRGDVPVTAVQKQITVLNRAYASAGFQFRLASMDRATNTDWFNADVDDNDGRHVMDTIRARMHKGSVAALNLYSLNLQNDLLGVANYPWAIDNVLLDSVVVHFSALPDQGYDGYNRGMTAVHEVGHWLGLYHVFQGGCSEPNDRVSDTGLMAGPNYNCVAFNKRVSTCSASRRKAGDPGFDPTNNYLGYAPDDCMNAFTPGQAVRMRASWDAYRKVGQPKISAPAPTPKPTKKAQKVKPTPKKVPKRKATPTPKATGR